MSAYLLVILAYLIGITWFGARFRTGQRTLRDYFLGGRQLPWWAIAFSIVATETSLLTVIGTPALAFAGNLGFLQLVLGYNLGRILICLIFIPQYFRGEMFTAYQLIEKRFGARMKSIAAGTFLLTRTLAEGVRVAAITKVISVAFGIETRTAVVLIAALTILYTFEGGMKAVVWTDVLQMCLMYGGMAIALATIVRGVPGGFGGLLAEAYGQGKFKAFLFDWTFAQPTVWVFTCLAVTTIFLQLSDQALMQRALSASDERAARNSVLLAGSLILPIALMLFFIGTALFVFYRHRPGSLDPALPNDSIFPYFVLLAMLSVRPHGMFGRPAVERV